MTDIAKLAAWLVEHSYDADPEEAKELHAELHRVFPEATSSEIVMAADTALELSAFDIAVLEAETRGGQ